ncbi:MAG: hypothetical protein F4Z60_05300 [Chloroflexi bacterium]|nr:hypothetical protein [Chloroflexota bacterium]
MALPIWMDFMRAYVGDRDVQPQFDPPTNIVFVSVNPETGEPAGPGTFRPIEEAFIAGTEPGTAFPR